MIYRASVEDHFSSAHALRGYKGKCENLHGHNWKVIVTLEASRLDKAGMLMDFADIRKKLNGIIKKLDHKHINKLKPFDRINPTAENIAGYIFNQMEISLKSEDIRVYEVKVWESERSFASAGR